MSVAYLGVTEGDLNFGDMFACSSFFGMSMQVHSRNTRVIGKDFNFLHRGCGSLRCNTQRLENSFFTGPSRSERSSGIRLGLAVSDLLLREVSRYEVRVIGWNSGD